jgi:hypothetical protein
VNAVVPLLRLKRLKAEIRRRRNAP